MKNHMIKQKNHNQFIRCLENIQDLSGQKLYNYAMLLNGGAYSRKTIKYDKKRNQYEITNHIDETHQTVTEIEIINNRGTLLGEAIKKRSLIALID